MPHINVCRAVSLCLILASPAASAADFSDPTWPCIQRKVENLSIGLMWPNPIGDVTLSGDVEAAVDELVGRLVLRRVPMEDVEQLIADFARSNDHDAGLLGQVFSRVFDKLAADRQRIISGIGDYSLKQIALSKRIETARSEMDGEMAKESPDFDKVDTLEEQIDWDERIYTDRQKSLTFVCETPVLLEKRLYAIAQLLAAAAEE